MKPLQLTMQAFGPYATEAKIDFRPLRNGGLFLIHGPTGAGKTSILDGLCFALFGKASGDRSSEGLRCDSASAELRTEVTLEFALGETEYRIIRWPKQQLKKKRGEGLRNENPQGELFKLTGTDPADHLSWQLIVSGDKKTDLAIYELLGMTEEQFRQVVVLPQGQFRRFLSATSDAREKLLETLFRTETHRRVSEALMLRAESLRNEVQARRVQQEALFAQLEVTTCTELEQRLLEHKGLLERLAGGAEDLQKRFDLATARLQTAQNAVRLARDQETARQQQAKLTAEQPRVASLTARLENELRSRPVLALDQLVLSAEKDLAALNFKLSSQKTRASESALAHQVSAAEIQRLEKLVPEIEAAKEERQRLREAWPKAESLKLERELAASAEVKWRTLENEEKRLSAQLTKLKQERDEKSLASETLREAVAKIQSEAPARRSRLELLSGQCKALANELTQLQNSELRQAQARVRKDLTVKERDAAQTTRSLTLLDDHLFQAARLAEELEVDLPCPVCGSLKHPKPAHRVANGEGPALAERLEISETRLRETSEAVAREVAQLESAEREVERSRLQLKELGGGEHPPTYLATLKVELVNLERGEKDEGVRETKLAREYSEIATMLKRLLSDTTLAENGLASTLSARDQARLSAESSRAKVQALEAILPAHLQDIPLLKTLGQELAAKISDFETALQKTRNQHETASRSEAAAREALTTLTDELEGKTLALNTRLNERAAGLAASGFASLELCRAAHLTADALKQLEQERRVFEDAKSINNARLKELASELATLPAWALGLNERQGEFDVVDRERTEALAQTLAGQERLQNLASSSQKLTQLELEITSNEARYSVFGKLAAVAAGQPPHNLTRVSFQRFVLAAFLDDVLEEASRRLFAMSRGQFILRRATTQEDKRRTAGLELEVEDALSGTARSTSSLSGGEGFMASLCLALGLADVVQSQLGGLRLEAVFVDEGFGTLDAESLELAMRSMSDLQAGGRIVGVISHVSELKEQISRRLHVRKSPHGDGVGSHVAWETSAHL